jgi:hypothetical protein
LAIFNHQGMRGLPTHSVSGKVIKTIPITSFGMLVPGPVQPCPLLNNTDSVVTTHSIYRGAKVGESGVIETGEA